MNIILKKLTPKLCEDFLNYFDNVAFSDHEEWAYCYCLECHLDKKLNDTMKDKNSRRELAKAFIERGVMQGYLAYDEEQVVGWCNSDDKTNYRYLFEDEEYLTEDAEKGKIKVIYCYDIAPAYRGKGIAGLMLEKACADAKEEGFECVEVYPFSDVAFEWQYHGTTKMYEQYGFEMFSKRKWFTIMRKNFKLQDFTE